MWKRDEAVKADCTGRPRASPGAARQARRQPRRRRRRKPATAGDPQRGQEKTAVNIGKSVVIKGELNGSEDLTIEGQVEGKIELRQNVLTIGAERQDQGAGVRQGGDHPRRGHRQRHRDARRSTSATTARSTATSPPRAWRLPKARTSAAASTCRRARRRRPSEQSHDGRRSKPRSQASRAAPAGAGGATASRRSR